MKRLISVSIFVLLFYTSSAQLSGIISVPSVSFATLANVISSLNSQGVSGALTINIAAGYMEQAPLQGYSLTASGTLNQPIIFQKSGSGANPLLIAYTGGNGTPGSMNQDGIWRLIGSDYITIDGIDLLDTNVSNPATMEFGFGLFKASAGNGCWNNTIKNCVITLNRINNASGTGPAEDGSRGIDVVNAYSNVHNAAVTVTASSGSHSTNHFYGNVISNCNIGISLYGFNSTSPYNLCDNGNEIGGTTVQLGNQILNFGGGGTSNASSAIKASAQYDFKIQYNYINNNTGVGINHAGILKGIQTLSANDAETSISHNTITLASAGINNQLVIIENTSGSNGIANKIKIDQNKISNCTYTTAISPTYYGIWNSASPSVLSISQNSFVNNSSNATGGSTYLIYNSGSVADSILIDSNRVGFVYAGLVSYAGTLYVISNTNGTLNTHLSISKNVFEYYFHLNSVATGNLYFIYNTASCKTFDLNKNRFKNLKLNHSGSHYLLYNSSATQSLLSVCQNSIIGNYERTASSGSFYGYYANGNSPVVCTHSICENDFSNIQSPNNGTGVFYGIYDSDGNTSPYPKKIISKNKIKNVNINSTGIFYGFYLDALGDAGGMNGSEIFQNILSGVSRSGNVYGLYLASASSPNSQVKVFQNEILDLYSSGTSSTLYFTYLANAGAGVLFSKNKLALGSVTGTNAVIHGIYVNSTVSNTLQNNVIGDLVALNSSATNAINGVYINSGSLIHAFYNTIYLNAMGTGGNFNSNALYTSTTASLNLRNSILYNTSSGGTGITAAYRRSSTNLTTYSTTSNSNLFYAGLPSTNRVLFQSGATSYQNLNTTQIVLSPRDLASITQTVSFLSLNPSSPNYLHVSANVSTAIESGAFQISGINEDCDSEIRQGSIGYIGTGTAPDMGSDEFELNVSPCSGIFSPSLSPVSLSLCAGQSANINAIAFTGGTGIQFQWKVSTNSMGPFVNVSNGNGMNTPEYSSANLNSGTYYFVLESTCTNVAMSSSSQQVSVVVFPIPSVSASVLSNLVCEGQSISLLGSTLVSGEFQWFGPNAFVAEVQNPILTNVSSNASGTYSLSVRSNGCASATQTVSVNVSSLALSITANPSMVCAGNSSTLNVISSANSYTWNNGSTTTSLVISPSATTVYSVIATNSAYCIKTASLTINLISPSIQAIGALLCGNSGTVNLSVNAFSPSMVNWYSSSTSSAVLNTGNSFSLILNGDSTLYAQASHTLSGCSSLRVPVSATLSSFPTLTVSVTSTLICPGKSTVMSASGAQTYSWVGQGTGSTKTVSPNYPSTYTVIGKTNFGCIDTKTISIFLLPSPTLSSQQSATIVCPSSLVQFTANGAVSYTWNTGSIGSITSVMPGANTSYTVYGTNLEGCISSNTLGVSTRSVPLINIIQSKDSICPGEFVSFSASGANSYTWLPSGKTSTSFSMQIFENSVVNALGKSVNSCTNLAYALIHVDPCTNISKPAIQEVLDIYPNPIQDKVIININREGLKQVSVFNTIGQELLHIQFTDLVSIIDVSSLPKGVYLMQLTAESQIIQHKLIKN